VREREIASREKGIGRSRLSAEREAHVGLDPRAPGS